MARRMGIEEELLLIDPETRRAVAAAPRVLKLLRDTVAAPETWEEVDPELFRHQLEIRTTPVHRVEDAVDELRAARRTASEAAASAGLAVAAGAVAPLGGDLSRVSPDDRYRDMVDTYGEVALAAGTCGMHVHVEVDSDEEGVAVIDRIAPWLPALVAVSANSPFSEGRDTSYASWRSQVWRRWPSAGSTERFGSVEGYRAVCRTMIESGAARDVGMLYFDARLAARQPTVEIRVCDVCVDPETATLVAALARGLVETAARDWARRSTGPTWRAEELTVAHWRAARFGLAGSLVDPSSGSVRPAREVLDAMIEHTGAALAEAGDETWVRTGLERTFAAGGDAARQRAAFERTGEVAGVVDDLLRRTAASWERG